MSSTDRFRRRALLTAVALAAAVPCCSASPQYPVLTQSGVREEAGKALGCDPAVIRFEQEPPGYRGYLAQGCGRTMALECTEDASGVHCHRDGDHSSGSSEGDGDEGSSDSDSGGGCGCGHLFHGKNKTNEPPSNNNPTSTTPQRTKR
jgi:hypothetical protein